MSVILDQAPDEAVADQRDRGARRRDRPWSLLALLALMAALPFIVNPFFLGVVVLGAIYAVAVLGLHFLMGLSGQLSLAQGAFFGLGAYTAAILSTRYDVPFAGTMAATVVAGVLIGLALGYATLRLTGHYLALATIGFAVIAHIVFLQWRTVTNGPDGISGTKRRRSAGSSSTRTSTTSTSSGCSSPCWPWSATGSRPAGSGGPGWRSARTSWRPPRAASTS